MSNPFDFTEILEDDSFKDLLAETNRYELEINKIKISGQVRENFDDESLKELSESIKKHGVLQNIIVCEQEDGFLLVAGERRVRAAKIAQLEKIPALVLKNLTDEQVKQVQLLENIQRENLSAIELANALERDLKELDGDYEALSKLYNKSRSWLSKAMQINKVSSNAAEVMKVSADTEVILGIQALEKKNPELAKNLTKQIKDDFGKKNSRKAVQDALKKEKEKEKEKTGIHVLDFEAEKEQQKQQEEPQELLAAQEAEAPQEEQEEPQELLAAQEAEAPQEEQEEPQELLAAQEAEAPQEEQESMLLGSELDLFCFDAMPPEETLNAMQAQKDSLLAFYEQDIDKDFTKIFIKTLLAAGFKLDKKQVNLKEIIHLAVLINATEPFSIKNFSITARDLLKATGAEN